MTSSPAAFATGHRLAGEHRLVDRGRALDDDAVDREAVAGPDPQQVAGLDLLERDAARSPPRLDEPGRRRLEADQAADRAARPGLRPGLEPAPEQDRGRG